MNKSKLLQTSSPASTRARRHLIWTLWVSILSVQSFLTQAVAGQAVNRSDNRGYVVLENPDPTPRPELILYCWAGSVSCYQLEQALSQWAKEQQVRWLVQPVIKRPAWRLLAKARLVATQMGHEQTVTQAIYQQLHIDQQPIETEQQLLQLIESLELDVNRFTNLYYAAETNQLLIRLDEQAASYQVQGVPSLIVNRQWLLDASMHDTSRSILTMAASLMGLEKP